MIIKQISISMWKDNHESIKAVQGEYKAREVEITFIDAAGSPVDLTGTTPRLYVQKNANPPYYDGVISDATGGKAIFPITSDMVSTAGEFQCYITITGTDMDLRADGITLTVDPADIDDAIAGSNALTSLQQALVDVQNVATNKVDKSTTINGLALTGDISLNPANIGAATEAQGTLADNAVPSSKLGAATGVATTNANNKVVQDPASYGQANGGATLNADGKVVQDPATAYLPLPEFHSSNGVYWTIYSNGKIHIYGAKSATVTVTSAFGSVYKYDWYTITLPVTIKNIITCHINVAGGYALWATDCGMASGSNSVINFNILAAQAVQNVPVVFTYDFWGTIV